MPELTRRSLLAATTAAAAAATLPASAADPAAPSLKGKSVFITGASSGFGRVGAEHYARLGAKVFATMRNLPRPEANELIELAARESLDITVLPLDVQSDAEIAEAVGTAQRMAGGALDIVINNAGIGVTGPVEVQDMAATQLAFDTNVFGVQRVIRAVLPAMRARKSGLIFNISSQLGRVIAPAGGHYSATKFALEALSEQLAYELAPHGVEVCIIQPGGYPTKVWVNRNRYNLELKARIDAERAAGYPELIARMGTETGSGRSADPADVPRAIAEIAALPAGRRPLRRAVHPGNKPQEAINRVAAETQVAWLGNSPVGPWVKAVHD
ncbi:SDR family oxidoreductase [Novosphingobium sp.]|uniref:SDR family oxidoreductase n=1 Tax=Novosphingobium sp. TaxID=1874826 RepID=UPI00273253A7|nr:SDR family oxidoreductase [Novosphingobium sp.]MDP3905938.1 SDR family oxidoreductase [Novosphingobium sp.]